MHTMKLSPAYTLMIIVVMALAFTGGAAHAEPATSAPTTAPGVSPKAALKAYNAAMRAGDADGIVALQHAANDAETRAARAIANSEVEVAKLLAAAQAKFGHAGAGKIGRAIGDVSDADIDAANETVTGQRALLRFATGGSAAMVCVDGEWKASVADVVRSAGGNAAAVIDHFTRRGGFARGLAQDISGGRVKGADEAVARIERHERGVSDDDPSN
jgi:hypothetical protein